MEPLLVLTIGQAPRPDLEAELRDVLGDYPLEVRGALDGLGLDEIVAIQPIDAADALHTWIRTGSTDGGSAETVDVLLSKNAIGERLSALITEAGDRLVIVGCTGVFSGITPRPKVLFPSTVLDGAIDATLPPGHRLGVLVPIEEQVALFTKVRGRPDRPVSVAVAKPGSDVTGAASTLADEGVDLVVLDCFGYDRSTLDTVRRVADVPVLSAVRLTGLLAAELVGSLA